MNGWLILDKAVGPGSTDCVTAVKRAFRDAGHGRVKVGHGGTLDPLASGVLPIALGEATKLAGRMLDSDKAYDFTVRFGEGTDTLDAEGAVVATSDVRPTRAALDAVLARFTGAIRQVPPAYSALKVDGERAYDRARRGEDVTLLARDVTIHALSVTAAGDGMLDAATLSARVSKGTYIRSLARDIAEALGSVGHVTMLRRTRAGPFGLAGAVSLDFLRETAMGGDLAAHMLPLGAGLVDIPAVALDPDQATALRQGRSLGGLAVDDGLYAGMAGDVPVALVDVAGGSTRIVRGFNL